MATYLIPAANVPRLQERIAGLVKKAAKILKKGEVLADATPITLVVGQKVVKEETDDITGKKVKRTYFEVEVAGPTPQVAGYTFVATLQHEEAGVILRPVPTVTLPEGVLKPFRIAKPACDHCKAIRRRNDTFVVREDATGALRQIGRNCLQDFLGGKSPEHMAAVAQFLATLSHVCEEYEGWGFGGGGELTEDTADFLTFVACTIREDGWTSRSKAREQDESSASADLAWNGMHPDTRVPEKDRMHPTDKDAEHAKAALAWTEEKLTASDPDALSDYEHNLKVALAGGFVTWRLAGIVASAINYYDRAMAKEAAAKAPAKVQGHVGTIGKRQKFGVLTLVRVFSFDSQFGTTFVHKFLDAEGHTLVWKTGSENLDPGKYEVTGTVKSHDQYKGEDQTVLTRCKVVEIEAPCQPEVAAPSIQ